MTLDELQAEIDKRHALQVEHRGLNREDVRCEVYHGHGDDRTTCEKVADVFYEFGRGAIRRAKSAHVIVTQRFSDDYSGGLSWIVAGYILKGLICVAFLPLGGMPNEIDGKRHFGVTAGEFNYQTLYAGWEAEFVRVAEGWRHWSWAIESDGDWNM